MTTGYEAGLYRDITMIRETLQSIDRSLKVIAQGIERSTTPLHTEPPPDTSWVHTASVKDSTKGYPPIYDDRGRG
jgi:hypothetical protein